MIRRLFPVLAALVCAAAPASAQRLPTSVTPSHYDVALSVDLGGARFEGVETIRVDVAESTTRVVLHALDLALEEVTIGAGSEAQKAAVSLDTAAQTATLTVARPIPKGASQIHIRFGGTLNDQLRGFYLSTTIRRRYAVTQFESTDARRAFPCFDEPAFKATFAMTVTLDRGDIAISNGRLVSDTPGPGPNRHTMKFATTPRMSSYLVAIAVGDFQCLSGGADGTPIRICATPDKKDLGRIALGAAEQILRFYNRYYAIKYPFGKLDVVAVPDFAAGAMENTAAIFYREADLLADERSASVGTRKQIASVLAHEIAHQWFGNLVTMRWWDDIWLNEGFATWMANKPLTAQAGWNVAVDEALETQRALELDALGATRPVHVDVSTPAEIDEAFDAITYEKGASVLRMVERYVGVDAFRKGINAYLQAHAYGNAASEDFFREIAAASGKPVERILPTFVNQPGVPLVEVSVGCTGNRTSVTFRQQRFGAPAASGTSALADGRWQIPVCFRAGAATTCDVLTEPSKTIVLDGGSCVPWVFANAGADGYYRTAYAPEQLRAMAPHVGELTAPERLSLLGDEWAMVRSGRHSAADYLTLAAGYGGEHTSGVLDELLRRVAFIDEYLTPDSSKPRLAAFVRSLLRPLYDEIGFTEGGADTDERRSLRATVVEALGTLGDDRDVAARARSALAGALAGGPQVEPTLAEAVTATAAAHGDAVLFDALATASERAMSPEDKYRYLLALARFRNPALIDRALGRALAPAMRAQDAASYLAAFFDNGAARPRAWTFVTTNWTALEPKIAVYGADTRLVSALGAFCDPQARDAIRTFFTAHPLPAAARTLAQTIERITNCIAMRDAQAAAVTGWLEAR